MNESRELIIKRLLQYNIKTKGEADRAIREISQEIVLASLAEKDFFNYAAFHGGTALRIVWGSRRYSEDLDFSLEKPNPAFQWEPYLNHIQETFRKYGCILEVKDNPKLDNT
jgi:predicted nucleotidyltransferase component of viral defense system